eukprot:TRINITY_DN67437_c6_g1_i1.p2 TRINITY_DN67437_c6_g1~~TRINITY_DN67437_c6_g1_i1.p2  ORF type:complete len:108 (+),score=6.23 TRINITY_DN67437_c6_g1_i1:143-466(+)
MCPNDSQRLDSHPSRAAGELLLEAEPDEVQLHVADGKERLPHRQQDTQSFETSASTGVHPSVHCVHQGSHVSLKSSSSSSSPTSRSDIHKPPSSPCCRSQHERVCLP